MLRQYVQLYFAPKQCSNNCTC